MEGRSTGLINSRSTLEPKFIYACRYRTDQLLRANLLTGEQSCHQIPGYQFKYGCLSSELPGGSLLITGGYPPAKEVVKIDASREYAVSSQPPIHTARYSHSAVYYSQYLYVLGGCMFDSYLSECERYVCAESRWEMLDALPVACRSLSAVELEGSLYALGGRAHGGDYDTVQKFSLDSLTWELAQLKLPQAACSCPIFKTDTQVYLMIKETLYSFTPLQIKPITTLDQSIMCASSYYSRGTLYYAWNDDIKSLVVGELA